MPYTTNNGVRISWQEQGTGTPLLLIMGHAFPGEMWWPVLPTFTAKHRVIWFDNRGTGRSGATRDATISDLAGDARAVLDAADVEQAHVYGVSMGGGVALQLAYESPARVTSMVLGCTSLKAAALPERKRTDQLKYYVPLRLLRKHFRANSYGPACPDEMAEQDLDVLMRARISPKGLLGQVAAMRTYDLTADKVVTMTTPALVLHGDADATVDVSLGQLLHDTLPDSRIVIYPGAGHNFVVAASGQANADVLQFLEQVEATSLAS